MRLMTRSKFNIISKIAFAGLLLLVIFLSLRKFHNTKCCSVEITIKDFDEVKFVDQNDVRVIITNAIPNISGYLLDSIDISKLHDSLMANPYIRKSSIYKTVSGKLKIDIQQRKPILLVLGNNQNYYIDEDACIFSASQKYHSKTIVANGSIRDTFDFKKSPIYKIDLKDKEANPSTSADLFKLTQLIQADDFWSDQIEQIYVTPQGEYELVPMMGQHIIALGTMYNYDYKMYVLKQFYFKALSKLGWNTYKLISVKYNGQIVCKKK